MLGSPGLGTPGASGAAGSVQSLGTTATAAESQGNLDAAPVWEPEWKSDLEHVWRTRVRAKVLSLEARARRRRRQAAAILVGDEARRTLEPAARDRLTFETWKQARSSVAKADAAGQIFGTASGRALRLRALRSAEWAEERARALALERRDILDGCGKRWRTVACGCGHREFRVGCDQPQLCLTCRKKHARRWRVRITDGMDLALRAARARWHRAGRARRRGMLPGIYLVTLTAPHSGDLETDRIAMGKAVRKLLQVAAREEWWSTYALTWEATAGRDGLGHMHAHVAVVSGWIPYTSAQAVAADPEALAPRRLGALRRRHVGLREAWARAMPGAVVVDVQAPRRGADNASSAGQYLAKYVTKGVEPAEFTGRKAGELLCAFLGRRKVSTSRHFWRARVAECECCKERYRSIGSPISLQELMPGAVLRAWRERLGWHPARGAPQVLLRWSERPPG